jgi:glyoxylate/hydroxypyruvate reductase A
VRLEKREFGVGILGMGVLGRSVADAVAKLGFPVAGLSRRSKQLQGMRSLAIDELAAFLASSRVLVCMLPLTPATRGLLGRKAFAMMPRGAYLINVARGAIVVEHDLIDAIDEGSIAGAMLDVFEHEPLAADHAFWHHPRITVTPHIAAVTLLGASVGQIADKIRRIEAGFPVSGTIDPLHAY